MKLKLLILYLLISTPICFYAQVLYSDGAVIHVNNGGLLYVNGGAVVSNSSTTNNEGVIELTKNSSMAQAGNFVINSNAAVSGSGLYRVEQDWINDAVFNADNSEVELFGDTEQAITSNNGTNTAFYNLTLTGSGIGVDSRKSLVNVNSSTLQNGVLKLNDRELSTGVNIFEVVNPHPLAILFDDSYEAEGFVSSLPQGFLVRSIDRDTVYIFPVGSSDGDRRFRPVIINTYSNESQSYAVRMNNFISDNEGFPITQHEPEIVQLNDEYYHSVRRLEGSTDAGLGLFYDTLVDIGWMSIGHWNDAEQQWKDVTQTNTNSFGDYNYVLKNAWDFPIDSDEYILINVNDPSDSENPLDPPIVPYTLSIPNVLTPNGDNVNDGFYVTSTGLTDFNIQILNRWGNLVFESDDVNEVWDGTNLNLKECTDGVYFYIIRASYNTEKIEKHGHITLVRNK